MLESVLCKTYLRMRMAAQNSTSLVAWAGGRPCDATCLVAELHRDIFMVPGLQGCLWGVPCWWAS